MQLAKKNEKGKLRRNLLVFGVKLFGNVGLSVHGDCFKNESEREVEENEGERKEEEEDPRSNWSFDAFSPLVSLWK